MNKEKMIQRAVSKGWNPAESVERLAEILNENCSEQVRIMSLKYWGFISNYQAEKMFQEGM